MGRASTTIQKTRECLESVSHFLLLHGKVDGIIWE